MHATFSHLPRTNAHSERTIAGSVCSLPGRPGADVQATDLHSRSPLYYAAMLGNLDITSFLLRKGAKDTLQDKVCRLAIHEALYGRHIDVARAIAEAGVDIHQRDSRGQDGTKPGARVGVRLDKNSLGLLLHENFLKGNRVGKLGKKRRKDSAVNTD